jgi:hypothetical protein
MKRFVAGEGRRQGVLLPEQLSHIHCLQGYIAAATVTDIQRLSEKSVSRNTSRLDFGSRLVYL